MPNDLNNHGPSRTTANSLGNDLKDEKNSITSNTNNNVTNCNSKKIASNLNRKLPAKAIVIQQRIPNAYDKKALKLEVCLSNRLEAKKFEVSNFSFHL